MALREHWYETLEWARMEGDSYFLGKPMRLPKEEFPHFQKRFLTRLESIVKVARTAIINYSDVKFLWWMWLNLDAEQKQWITDADHAEVIPAVTKLMTNYPAVVESMTDPYCHLEFWSTGTYITIVRNLTPKCKVSLDRETLVNLFHEYQSSPVSARYRNLAVCYDGTNADDVMAYVGEGCTLLSSTPKLLILDAPKGNTQILKDQWVWFSNSELKHGNLKTFTAYRLSVPDQRNAPGFWIKPNSNSGRALLNANLCPEVII